MPSKHGTKEIKELKALFAKAAAFEKKGLLAEAARSYRLLLSRRPEPAAYFNYAAVLKKLQATDEALLNYRQAVALKPDYAEAFVNIGSILMGQGAYEQALAHYDKAVAFHPGLAEAFYNRGVALQELRRHDEALADYDRTLALRPDDYLAYLNKSVILYELKRKAEAARNYERMLAVNPEQADACWNLGILRLSEGDFAAGWRLSEARLRPHADYYNDLLKRPYWRGESEGQTVFVKWEQGFGDTIQFCRYAKLLRRMGVKVVLSVQAPLRRLVQSLDPEIEILGEDEVPARFDTYCLLMSLPHLLGTTVTTIPYPTRYLSVAADAAAHWRTRLGAEPKMKVGLVWAGGARPEVTCARRNDANRSVEFEDLAPMLAVEGVQFVSLQKGPAAAQLAAGPGGEAVRDWTGELADFADTGALVEALDLVITVDTAVAHLAAALGKTVWILVPWTSCWRWLEGRTDSPWYESVRLFRQSERGNWDHVVAGVSLALRGLVAATDGGRNE